MNICTNYVFTKRCKIIKLTISNYSINAFADQRNIFQKWKYDSAVSANGSPLEAQLFVKQHIGRGAENHRHVVDAFHRLVRTVQPIGAGARSAATVTPLVPPVGGVVAAGVVAAMHYDGSQRVDVGIAMSRLEFYDRWTID